MALNDEENVYRFINFDDDWCSEEYLDEERRNYLMCFDDSESDEEFDDIVDLLPNDPFEMEFNLGLPIDPFHMDFITGWIEDCGLKAYGFETDEAVEDNSNDDDNTPKAAEDDSNGDSKIFAELNFVWTESTNYDQEDWENEVVDSGSLMCRDDGSSNDLMCSGSEENVKDDGRSGDGGAATDIIIFVLGYLDLGVEHLLSLEQVCKSLRDAVRKDPYLWTTIHIDYPLSLKITNDDLLRLTDRAQGRLRSLSVVKCLNITNDGLKQVLERNLELTKLSVAGSIKLRVEGVLQNLKVFNSVALPGIQCLRIGWPVGLTNEHLKEFKLLLGADEDATTPSNYKPRFYRAGEIYLSLDDERAIDVETCPRCQKLGQVYDCPNEYCQANKHSAKSCRACIFCIARCIHCGCCLDDKDYEETFYFEFLCSDCLNNLFDSVPVSHGRTCFHQMANYHFFLYR